MTRFNFAPVAISRAVTRQWKIAELGVVLTVASATEANKPYWNAHLVAADQHQGGQRLAGAIADNRAVDVGLFADHVLKGWSGVEDDKGPVPFSAAAAREWLTDLVEGGDAGVTAWVFDELRKFCRDQGNFIAAVAGGGLVKNS